MTGKLIDVEDPKAALAAFDLETPYCVGWPNLDKETFLEAIIEDWRQSDPTFGSAHSERDLRNRITVVAGYVCLRLDEAEGRRHA